MSVAQKVLETFRLEKLESKQPEGFGSQEPVQTLECGQGRADFELLSA